MKGSSAILVGSACSLMTESTGSSPLLRKNRRKEVHPDVACSFVASARQQSSGAVAPWIPKQRGGTGIAGS